ncbi:helix-turn-helix domain-containing protein [Corynebacterium variabile]|uniref:helix-turn-helix domain-containing protein n=1 Tax=Corynebacterium variabile TaxID=1727 RepID=UPI003A93926A
MAVGDLQKQVGAHLRAYRLERDMSQEAFAEFLGYHRTYAGALERGERNISLQSLEELAARIGVEAMELLGE